MKKFYGYFIYNDNDYVIRFKVDGIAWDPKQKCFIDPEWYVRTAEDMICLAAFDTHWSNVEAFSFGFLISHKTFNECRSRGIKRWTPQRPEIHW